MPVENIRDRRTNHLDTIVSAVFEDAWHDNICEATPDHSKFPEQEVNVQGSCDYAEINRTTVGQAIRFAAWKWPQAITLYLYSAPNCPTWESVTECPDGSFDAIRYQHHQQ